MMEHPNASAIQSLLVQLKRELDSIQPDSDLGLLPVREIVSQLTEKSDGSEIHPFASQALAVMDGILDALRTFNQQDIELLKDLYAKMSQEPSSTAPATTDFEPILSKIETWLDQLAMELVLAEPETDKGLLPIRELLNQMSDKSSAVAPLHVFCEHTKTFLAEVDAILEAQGLLKTENIDSFSQKVQNLKSEFRQSRPVAPEVASSESTAPVSELSPLPHFELPPTILIKTPPAETSPQPPSPSISEVSSTEPAQAPVTIPEPSKEEPSLSIHDISDPDLIADFMNESAEHLQNIELGVLQLEDDPHNAETLNSVFRAYHTLKGGSGFLNLKPINRLAHELESLLDLARQEKLTVTSSVINLILEGGDTIKKFVEELKSQLANPETATSICFPTLGLIARVKAMVEGKPEPQPSTPVPSTSEQPEPNLAEDTAPSEPALHHEEHVEQKAVRSNTSHASVGSSVVKVETQKLDSLFDMVGEMVIAQSLISQDPELVNIKDQKLIRNLSQLARITNELQKTAMSIRMVPIRATFQKMTRVVRDIAAKSGKHVNLRLSGEDTELDRTIVEEISDPLVHMVRNSVDHGIEPTEARLQNGKPATGEVVLDAFHQGGNIVIQIRDDGGGLNSDKIRAKAIERGMISQDDELSEKEIFNLIFAPGFSTAEKITDISGRGVGMDVVRKNIEKLRGKIEIESIRGKGTTFSIYLPLTLAIIEGLIVRINHHRYILPTLAVRESFRPTPQMISTVQRKGEMINVRGKLLPVTRLYNIFDLEPSTTDPCQAIVIVIESGYQQRCLMVDELVGKQEVVIKSLSDQLRTNHYLAGAAILGDGQVGLILDTTALVNG